MRFIPDFLLLSHRFDKNVQDRSCPLPPGLRRGLDIPARFLTFMSEECFLTFLHRFSTLGLITVGFEPAFFPLFINFMRNNGEIRAILRL